MSDLHHLFSCQDQTARWRAEAENAGARLELAQRNERAAFLISQCEPVASLGMDREHLRAMLSFLRHGDLKHLGRDLAALVDTRQTTSRSDLLALLDEARNWVQDHELRDRINAVCPPKQRGPEDMG